MFPSTKYAINTLPLQYLTDADGNKVSVVLPLQLYQTLVEAFEDLEDIALYDEAKLEDSAPISLEHYLANRKKHG